MERKSDLLQKDTLFYSLFENSRIGQVILDDQFRLVFANKRMYGFLDLESDHMEDMLFGQVFHCSNFGVSCSECGIDENGQCNLMHAIRIIRKGGIIDNSTIQFSFNREGREEIKWFQLNGSPVSYYDRNYILLIFADITDLKQREKRLKELLSLDLATGTTNKYGLVKSIKRRVRAGNNQRYSLCMIDFDNFKQLNDQYGHLFGDKVLEKFSDIAHRHIRKEDVLGRYGGEEFVFIFDGNDETQSFQILKRIHMELTKYFSKTTKQPVTFSAGIVAVDSSSQAMSYKELLGQADSLLYEAKKLGRARAMGHQEGGLFTE
jgi:diguanylate cyclase (GGDEF)-like protein/PAS domain S-box-containing protein